MKRPASFAAFLLVLPASAWLFLFAGSPANAGQSAEPPALRGYTAANSRAELDLEKRFAAIPSPERAREWHRTFTAEPHPAASARNNYLARYIADEWKKQGWDEVTVREYDVWHSAPKSSSLEMTAPVAYRAGLREDAYDADPDTKNPAIPVDFMGFSASGEVAAPVIYAHSGNPDDYALLKQHGIDPRGKIAIVRYSNPYSYRGFKALTAQREGVAALLIYSDPAEDGYAKGKVFPDGPWGPESHIQHGAITYDFMGPGDPQTPGWASVPGAHRIPIDQAVSVPKIICLPISWRDAKPLLEHMDGPEAPKDWQGALPITYRLAGAVQAHVNVQMDDGVKPYYVVDARILGSELPDQWIVMGNHRDAWVFGGVDPSSGTASMMEMTRALAALHKQGWRPKRTLIVCSWDGEEYGLTGSTEWGEQFADELRNKGVAYLNVDSSTSGPNLGVEAVPSLASTIVDVTRTLRDPSGTSLYDAWKKSRSAETKSAPVNDAGLVNQEIGSGSDHTVFLNFDGMPSVGMGFHGPYGVYHSAYDDFYWMNHFGDPGYRYHVLMSQLWGVLALRLAGAEVLPFDFEAYGRELGRFLSDLDTRTGLSRHIDLNPLFSKMTELEGAGRALSRGVDLALAQNAMDAHAEQSLNSSEMDFERNWLDPAGLIGRPWFKHLIYACRYTYAHWELPGLAEAAESGNWARAAFEVARLQKAVETNVALLGQAGSFLGLPEAPSRPTAVTSSPAESAHVPPVAQSLDDLRAQIESIRAALPGDMSVYMKNLKTGEMLALDADRVMETFSVIKVPIMAEVLRQSEAGKFALSDRITLTAGDRRLPSGMLYRFDPGLAPTIRDLLTWMIIISDNEATDVLAGKVGRSNVTRTMRELGFPHTTIEFSDLDWDRLWLSRLDPAYKNASGDQTILFPFHRFSDQQVDQAFLHTIYESGIYFGHSTTREIGGLFEKMARRELVSPAASDLMLDILREQQVNNRFPKYLDGEPIAHKTGDGQPWLANDAGIIWIPGKGPENDTPIVLVVFTGHHHGPTSALHDAIARVAAVVVGHYGGRLKADFKP